MNSRSPDPADQPAGPRQPELADIPALPERYAVREILARLPAVVRLRAFDANLAREVILEYPGPALRPELMGKHRNWILRDAKIHAQVEHPGVQRLREAFQVDHLPVLVLDPVAGEPLEAVLRLRGHLAPREVIDIGVQVAEALDAIHFLGAVHRDVATHNILCDGSTVAVRGFAFAKPIDGFSPTSLDYEGVSELHTGALPRHPAPEQLAGHPADARADVFGLGCVLYEALTGQPAFLDNYGEWSEPRDPRDLVPDAPAGLCKVVRRCLRASPGERYATMGEVAAALRELPHQTATPGTGGPGLRWWPPALVVAAALLTVYLWPRPPANGPGLSSGNGGAGSVPLGPWQNEYTGGRALLIATDYRDGSAAPPLAYPESDVEALAQILGELNWKVEKLPGRAATKRAIEDALDGLKNTGVDEQVLVYFSGHGASFSVGYVLPDDVAMDGAGPVISTCVPVERFETLVLKNSPAKHVMLVFDCCYSGSFVQDGRAALDFSWGEAGVRAGKVGPLASPHRIAIASCGRFQEAPDCSKFAIAFQQVLGLAVAGEEVTPDRIGVAMEKALAGSGQRFLKRTTSGEGTFTFKRLPPRTGAPGR